MKYTKDYYAILCVSCTVTNEEKTYENLSKAFHLITIMATKEFAAKRQ